MTEPEMQEVFRQMGEEPIPADSLARVRLGVDKRIGPRSWWKFAVPLVAAGCLVAGFLLFRPAGKPVPIVLPPPSQVARALPPVEIPVPAVSRPRRVPQRQRVEPVPVLIRIETPDPDVVILLVN